MPKAKSKSKALEDVSFDDLDEAIDTTVDGPIDEIVEGFRARAAAKTPRAPAGKGIEIPAIQIQMFELTLIGDSALITHRWSQKAKQQMLDKQMKRGKTGKEAKDPQRDYEESLYTHPDGGYGFPCIAFKAAAVGACRFTDGVKMTEARGAFHVVGELARIDGEPSPREDMVQIGMGVADIRYRGEFKQWKTTLVIRYNPHALSAAQIINLFNLAGFGVGVGEWRPEKNGSYGMFHVSGHNE